MLRQALGTRKLNQIEYTQRGTVLAYIVLGLAFLLFCVWFVFSLTQLGHRAEATINGLLPDWLVATNLVLLPGLMFLTAGTWRIRTLLRFGFGILMLCSTVILEVSFRRFLLGSCAVLAIVLVEVYWIIPKLNARHGRGIEPRKLREAGDSG